MIATRDRHIERWYPLRPHAGQYGLWTSRSRFKIVFAGRRSGKTELFKRALIDAAIQDDVAPNAWLVAAAPTHDQAKAIFWRDLCDLAPRSKVTRILEGELTIRFWNGAEISVRGVDKPQRIEGRPLDFIGIDEFADTRPELWERHVAPALTTPGRPPGKAWLLGVPRGAKHYRELHRAALAEIAERGPEARWSVHSWKSAEILSPEDVEMWKGRMDPLTYAQEFEASWDEATGRAYYPWNTEVHAIECLPYIKDLPLVLAFDFNSSPGICAIGQEHVYTGPRTELAPQVSDIIGEVWIPSDSNIQKVCNRIIKDWGEHKGDVLYYGDATGGAGGSAKVDGSDWTWVNRMLKPVFQERLKSRVTPSNPPERVRVNAMNARLMSVDGKVHFRVDPKKAPHVVDDFLGTRLVEGGSGELDKDKKKYQMFTHLTDACGYWQVRAHPMHRDVSVDEPL